MTDINELKKNFYNRFFPDYKDFMANTNLDPSKHTALNGALMRQNEKIVKSGKNPLVEGKDSGKGNLVYPNIHCQFDDQILAASIEEFFDIVSTSEGVSQKVSQILTFLEKTTGNGSEEEMANLTEDSIIKLIIKHFWEIKKWENLISYDKTKCYTKEGFDKGEYDYKALINGPLTCMLGRSYFYRTFLHICRKLRNENTHGENSFFGLQDGYVLNRFKLFVYVGTVLLLRKELPSPYNFSPRELTIYYDRDGLEVTLFDNDNEINPIREDDHHAVYSVIWYKDYRVKTVASQSKYFCLTWQSQSPSIIIKQGAIDVKDNEVQVNTSSNEVRSRAIMKSVYKGLQALENLGKSNDEISQKLDALGGIDEISQKLDALKGIDEFLQTARDDYAALIKKQDNYIDATNKIVEAFKEKNGKDASIEQLIEWLKLHNKNTDDIGKKLTILQTIILIVVFLLLIGMVSFFFRGRFENKTAFTGLTPLQLVLKGDSLLRLENYEEAGLFYKEALAGYKEIAASNPNACIKLAEMYTLGKGAYSLDSALHYARMAKSEPSGCGHGWYVFLLTLNDKLDEAEKQIPLAVDSNEEHMKIAKSFFILSHNPDITNKEKLEKSFKELQSSGLPEARMSCVYEFLLGIFVEDSTAYDINRARFIIAPDYAKAIKTLSDLQKSSPISYIVSGDLAKDFGFYNTAMMYYCMALQCGIDQAAPSILLMENVCNQKTTKKYKKFIRQARGLTNEQNNILAKTKHSIDYRGSGSIKYAIQTQEQIIKSIENHEESFFSMKLSPNKKRLATLLMLSGDSANKERAIGMVSALENSTDTLAISSYLQAICHMLKNDADDNVIDSLVWFAADRGFLPAIATRFKTKHPIEKASKPNEYYINYRINPETDLSESPEIAYLVANMCMRDEAFIGCLGDGFVDSLYEQCLPFTPREYRIQDQIGNFFYGLAHQKNEISIVKPELKTIQELYDQSQIGLRAALYHNQVEMARHFCLYSYLLLESANSFHGKLLAPIEMFKPFSNGRIDYYLKSGRMIDSFKDYFYQPLEYPISYYLYTE